MTLYSIPPLLTLGCFLALALLTILRGRRTGTNRLFFILCLLGSFLYLDILLVFNVASADTALRISRIDHFFIVYLFPVYIHFFHAYLNIRRRRWLIYAAYAYAFGLMCLTPTSYYIADMQRHFFGFFARGGRLYPLFGIGALGATIYILFLLIHAIGREKSNVRKNRLKYVCSGFAVMGLMNSLNLFPLAGFSLYPPGNLSFVPLIIFGIGLFRHDLLDMGLLIQKSLIYSLLTALLTGLYAFLILLLNQGYKEVGATDSIIFQVGLFVLIAFMLGPLKTRVQALIDRLFYKGLTNYRTTIRSFSQQIVSILDIAEIGRQLTRTVYEALAVDACALFLKNSSASAFYASGAQGVSSSKLLSQVLPADSLLAAHLDELHRPLIRQKLSRPEAEGVGDACMDEINMMHAEIILPMRFQGTLNGFIVLGEKRSGDLFVREDLDLLETLAGQSALAIENARAYAQLDDLNKNLEQKIAQRTRSLQDVLAEKEKTQEQLIQSESLAAIGQLVAGVAHELNNPLASVKSLIQATMEDLMDLGRRVSLDEDLLEDLRFADKELERARDIVKSLLGLSRQTQAYTEAVDLNAVVRDALRILYNQHKNLPLKIVEEYCEHLPEIQGNFANLGQVVLNIVQNAIQAVQENGGTIYLSTAVDGRRRQVIFECRDSGCGIAPSLRADIFKPFFTTKEVGQGTGLGLYICHEIIKKHNGALTLEEADGPGACFKVVLPAER